MKTTLNIDDHIMKRLKEEAARRDTTMSELVEAGLRRILSDDGIDQKKRRKRLPRRPTWSSGGSLVDVANRGLTCPRQDSHAEELGQRKMP